MSIVGNAVMLGGGGGGKHIPTFTYTGNYEFDTSGEYEVLRLLTSGTLTFAKAFDADVFLVGGGGGGGNNGNTPGGGGGYTRTINRFSIFKGTEYLAVIGAGGSGGQIGGSTSFDSQSVYGGNTDKITHAAKAGDGGSGGGSGGGYSGGNGGDGGSNGDDGVYSAANPNGTGQGTNTYEFGDTSSGKRYAGGGGGGARAGHYYGQGQDGGGNGNNLDGYPAIVNTGSGGGGTGEPDGRHGGAGGSGIICIRLAQ